jgi:hypothetical protein
MLKMGKTAEMVLERYSAWCASFEDSTGAPYNDADSLLPDIREHTDQILTHVTDYGCIMILDVRWGAFDHGAGVATLTAYTDLDDQLTRLDLWYEDNKPQTILPKEN